MTPGTKLTYRKRKKRGKGRGYKMITTQGEFVGYQEDRVLIRNKSGMVLPVPLYNLVDTEHTFNSDDLHRERQKRSVNDHRVK